MSLTVRDYDGVNIVVPVRGTLALPPCLLRGIYGLQQCSLSRVDVVL